VYTRGDVPVQVTVAGGVAETVELLLDNEPLVNLSPPYSYTWGTSGVPEGSHTLSVRAVRKGETFTSAVRTVVVDRTAPQVVARSPLPGAMEVSVHAPIRLDFSEPMLRASVTSSTFEISADGVRIEHGITISEDARAVELQLLSKPAVPSTLKVSIAPGLSDAAGNPVQAFAGEWSWESPAFMPFATPLSAFEGATDAVAPSLVLDDASGQAVVAWQETANSNFHVIVRRWDGKQWSDLDMGPDAAPYEFASRSYPRLALNQAGHPVVGYIASSGGQSAVTVAESDGVSWRKTRVGGAKCPAVSRPLWLSMALAEDGQPFVTFREVNSSDGNEGEVHVCRAVDGQWEAVGAPFSLPGVDSDATPKAMKIDTEGKPIVAWTQARDGVVRGFVSRWNGNSWAAMGNEIQPKSSGTHVSEMVLALAGDGTHYVAWSEFPTNSAIYVARLTGSSWQLVGSAIWPDSERPFVGTLSLALDARGWPVVSWYEYGDGTNMAVFMQRWTGARWSQKYIVSSNPLRQSSRLPVLSLERAEVPVIAFTENDGTSSSVYLQRFNQ
jgi:hypothetical protein